MRLPLPSPAVDLFVAGTDTGCGKTVVTAALALALAPGVTVVKPAQTGCPPDDDAAWVAAVTGCDAVVLERFAEPLAPAVCAERKGHPLDLDDLAERTLAAPGTHRLCESAGGLLAPLAGRTTMADLAAALDWPAVLAVRPALGTLNHTALTLEAAARRGIEVAGLVVSGFRGGTAEETNLPLLAEMAPVLAVLEYMGDPAADLPGLALSGLRSALPPGQPE